MIVLLDANVLIALINEAHVHHERARTWFAKKKPLFATCPITEGALIRHYFRETEQPSSQAAINLIQEIHALPSHQFWNDSLNYGEINYRGIIGHRQITDAYLVALAISKKGILATMDSGLSEFYPDSTTWIPPLP